MKVSGGIKQVEHNTQFRILKGKVISSRRHFEKVGHRSRYNGKIKYFNSVPYYN
jgi:hypothetical protein